MKTRRISSLLIFSGLCIFTAASSQTLEEHAREKIDSLQLLLSIAEDRSIPAESEKMTLRTAELFLKFADWDESNPGINIEFYEKFGGTKDDASVLAEELPDFERSQVNEILDRAIKELKLAIDSVYERKASIRPNWSQASISGNTIVQDNKPIFLLDHTWKPETKELTEFYGDLDGYYISPNYVADEAGSISSWKLNDLKNKPGGNIGSVFIGHTSLPDWAKNKYPDLEDPTRIFTKYDIDHPAAREMFKLLFKGTVPFMAGKNYTKLGYMLCNEPSFFTQAGVWNTGGVSVYTKDKFRSWLSNKHDSIAVLNTLWGTGFESFDSVKITIPISAVHEGTPMWYDWLSFNNHRVTDYFRFLKGEIRKYDPEARVHIKIMPWCWTGDKKDHGIDFEALTRLSDISGSDAQAVYNKWWGTPDSWGAWTKKYAFEWLEVSMTYDLFRSVKPGQIIFDTENHFLSTNIFRDRLMKADYPRAVYWLAHMHGLNAGRSWYWGRQESGEPVGNDGKGYPGTYMQQPRVLDAMHRALIDLNRYPEEITSIQQQRKPLRIYFSLANSINRSTYMEDVFHNYEGVYFEGIPLGFATDSIIIKSESRDWEAILVWKTESVTRQEFNTMQNYLDSGGTIIMDASSFKKDEYGRAHEALVANAGTILSVASLAEMKEEALKVARENKFLPDLIVSESNAIGDRACFWRCIKNENGNNVISIINLGKTNASLKIELPEAEIGTACRDLITGVKVNSDTILPPLGVMLLEVTEEEENIGVFKPGTKADLGASIFPNPTTGSFHIDLPEKYSLLVLDIFNLDGQLLASETYHQSDNISHNLEDQTEGVYILRLRSGNKMQHFKLSRLNLL